MIDLHLHLDGSLSKEDLLDLCQMNHISPLRLEYSRLSVDESCTSLNDYLECFAFPLEVLQTIESIGFATYCLLTRLASQGLRYVEIRFAPSLSTKNGLSQEDVVMAALQGKKLAEEQTGILSSLILCMMRGGIDLDNLETVRVAKKFLNRGVVAIDLAGAEALYPVTLYEDQFAMAKDLGVPFTVHAGEADGPTSVWNALKLGASRIGHGIRSVEDPELLDYLAKHRIPLEVCPTSEKDTHCIASYEDLPLRTFLEKGVLVTIATDDMTVSNITLKEEYEKLKKAFHLTEEEILLLERNGIEASFAPIEIKEKLYAELKK